MYPGVVITERQHYTIARVKPLFTLRNTLFPILSYTYSHMHAHTFTQALGGVLIGVGAWLEVEEQTIVAAVEEERFLYGPYLIIAAGAAIVLVAVIGMVGALCSHAVNRFLLVVVSSTQRVMLVNVTCALMCLYEYIM